MAHQLGPSLAVFVQKLQLKVLTSKLAKQTQKWVLGPFSYLYSGSGYLKKSSWPMRARVCWGITENHQWINSWMHPLIIGNTERTVNYFYSSNSLPLWGLGVPEQKNHLTEMQNTIVIRWLSLTMQKYTFQRSLGFLFTFAFPQCGLAHSFSYKKASVRWKSNLGILEFSPRGKVLTVQCYQKTVSHLDF